MLERHSGPGISMSSNFNSRAHSFTCAELIQAVLSIPEEDRLYVRSVSAEDKMTAVGRREGVWGQWVKSSKAVKLYTMKHKVVHGEELFLLDVKWVSREEAKAFMLGYVLAHEFGHANCERVLGKKTASSLSYSKSELYADKYAQQLGYTQEVRIV